MKICASLILRNEADRYLRECVGHLVEFVDEIRILDDGSTDGWVEEMQGAWGKDGERVITTRRERIGDDAFDTHADARNQLLAFTLDGWPDWVLAVDLDEFVSDGSALRAACEKTTVNALTTEIAEIWEACDDTLCIRQDGGWRSHPIANVWRAAAFRSRSLRITDRGHATGRVPEAVHSVPVVASGVTTYHFGWARRSERDERYARYRDGDGGRFHASAHIQSIAWPDSLVECEAREWPSALDPWRAEILERAAQ